MRLPFFAILRFLYSLEGESAFLTGLLQYGSDAFNIDGLDGFGRYLEGDPLAFFRNPEALGLKIRIEPALGLVICVGNIVSYMRTLSGNLTNPCHTTVFLGLFSKGTANIGKSPPIFQNLLKINPPNLKFDVTASLLNH